MTTTEPAKTSKMVKDKPINDDDRSAVNKRIYESLVKRDSKEKNVTVCKLVQANDSLVRMVTTLKMELDELQHRMECLQSKYGNGEKMHVRRIQELETLLREKDVIIMKMKHM